MLAARSLCVRPSGSSILLRKNRPGVMGSATELRPERRLAEADDTDFDCVVDAPPERKPVPAPNIDVVPAPSSFD
jgi:hypothetical protein